jgi:hypothetical protein
LVSGPTSSIEPPPKENKDEQGIPTCVNYFFKTNFLLEVCMFKLQVSEMTMSSAMDKDSITVMLIQRC